MTNPDIVIPTHIRYKVDYVYNKSSLHMTHISIILINVNFSQYLTVRKTKFYKIISFNIHVYKVHPKRNTKCMNIHIKD